MRYPHRKRQGVDGANREKDASQTRRPAPLFMNVLTKYMYRSVAKQTVLRLFCLACTLGPIATLANKSYRVFSVRTYSTLLPSFLEYLLVSSITNEI